MGVNCGQGGEEKKNIFQLSEPGPSNVINANTRVSDIHEPDETNLSDLDDDQLDKLQKEVKPKSTTRTDNWALNKLNGIQTEFFFYIHVTN